ncbi:DUF6841 family protein [Nocardia pseudobrasiliensis]|uniref:DUF6841 domain-containing protein n=1 Tax=Nocardia pseudobrasiliensis TaxID=45979 RepID=A0A370HYF3_9NOCA|nr:hypothetical protein [Nocardia pseudobrasiliensis]RDI63330.1 hypothetical protein DFR76_11027 [Nocardia pseudobrasiliensis]
MTVDDDIRREIDIWYSRYAREFIEFTAGRAGNDHFHRNYYSIPLYICEDGGRNQWLLTDAEVRESLLAGQRDLGARGYHHATILDRVIRVLHPTRVTMEIIVSRQRENDVEIERWAVGYDIAKLDPGWRIIDIYTKPTTADTVSDAWPLT